MLLNLSMSRMTLLTMTRGLKMVKNGYELAVMRFWNWICFGCKIKAWGPEVGFQVRKWVTATIKSWCFGGVRSFSFSGFSHEEVSVKLGLWKNRFIGTLCLVSLSNLCPFSLTNLVKSSEEKMSLLCWEVFGTKVLLKSVCVTILLGCYRVASDLVSPMDSFRIENKESWWFQSLFCLDSFRKKYPWYSCLAEFLSNLIK